MSFCQKLSFSNPSIFATYVLLDNLKYQGFKQSSYKDIRIIKSRFLPSLNSLVNYTIKFILEKICPNNFYYTYWRARRCPWNFFLINQVFFCHLKATHDVPAKYQPIRSSRLAAARGNILKKVLFFLLKILLCILNNFSFRNAGQGFPYQEKMNVHKKNSGH